MRRRWGARLILDEVEGSTTLDCKESGAKGYGSPRAGRTVGIVSVGLFLVRKRFNRQGRQGSPRKCGKELKHGGTTKRRGRISRSVALRLTNCHSEVLRGLWPAPSEYLGVTGNAGQRPGRGVSRRLTANCLYLGSLRFARRPSSGASPADLSFHRTKEPQACWSGLSLTASWRRPPGLGGFTFRERSTSARCSGLSARLG